MQETVLTQRLKDLAYRVRAEIRTIQDRIALFAPVSVGTAPPANPSVNDLWVDTN